MNVVNAEMRAPRAKGKQLRRAGLTPCCIYGSHLDESISIQITQSETTKLLRSKSEGGQVKINLSGESIMAIVEGIDRNPVKDEILHIDFHATQPNKKVSTKATIIIQGKEMVRGFVEQLIFEIPYMALPANLVETVVIDVAGMVPGDRMNISDLDIYKDENIEILMEQDMPIFTVRDNRTGAARKEDDSLEDAAE